MAKRRHTAEQIISKLWEAEILLAKGMKMPQVCRKLGVTEQMYYRWREECGARHLATPTADECITPGNPDMPPSGLAVIGPKIAALERASIEDSVQRGMRPSWSHRQVRVSPNIVPPIRSLE